MTERTAYRYVKTNGSGQVVGGKVFAGPVDPAPPSHTPVTKEQLRFVDANPILQSGGPVVVNVADVILET